MNKKFSTLLAGMALVSAVAVNAQEGVPVTPVTPATIALPTEAAETIPVLANMEDVKELKLGVNSELYQLQVGTDKVLAMDEDGNLELVSKNTIDAANMANTLWCVTVATQEEGQAPKFDFENRATGMILDIATNDVEDVNTNYVPTVGGNVSGWAFSRSYKVLEKNKALYSYIDAETILGFRVEGNELKVAKIEANKYNRDENKYDGTANYFATFSLMSPAEIFLTADQLNTIFGTYEKSDHGLKLTFDKDVLGTDIPNPFNAQSFYTESAGTYSGTNVDGDNVEVPYLWVRQKDKEAYLRVDTAYTNESGVHFLAYKWVTEWYDWDQTANKKGQDWGNSYAFRLASQLKDQYKFLFKYSPKNDNVNIYIHTVTYKADAEKYWFNAAEKGYNNRVSLQDLIKDKTRILTVDAENQNTKITLGYASCGAVTPTRTSLADNVYFIQNAKGQYLAAPIYAGGDIQWVTVNENQDVNHMPAYQWVVLKNNTSDTNNVSPLSFTNREYSNEKYENVQLNKKADENFYYVTKTYSSTGNVDITADDELTITAVAAEFQGDKYLGYKKIEKDDLLVNKFTFSYYHPYADVNTKFIAQSANDSTLVVLDDKDAFKLDTVAISGQTSDEAYGYNFPGMSKEEKAKRLPNLVQLYRTVYTVSKGDLKWYINKEDKFNVSKYATENDGNEKVGEVFFKENNCIDGTHYYAILTADYNSTKKVHEIDYTGSDADLKAGVSDYDPNATLKSQVLDETRTSAFAIAPDNTPLYRHFNNAALGENADDSTDSLVFVEKTRGEYLMDEWNENLRDEEVCYAGIWNAEKANGHLAFNIDTAWVNRGSGLVKPQYLISVARNDQSSIETIPCTEDGPHVRPDGTITTDPSECVHAIHGREGFIYGKFLVSFADSVANLTDKDATYDVPYMDVKNGYTRVGFVPAIKIGDSLVILTDEFKKVAPEKLDTATIFASYRANKQENFIVDLTGDNHKNVTWSFRYVNPDQAGNVAEEGVANEFLFESNIYTKNGGVASASNVATGNGKAALGYDEVVAGSIAPAYAAWLKMQNGCLVLTDATSSFGNAKTGGDGALIFNAYQKAADQDMVTDNEEIAVEEGVSVIAGNGAVTIQGAAGKTVVITNILGKAVANTVLTSDNQTINVPAGIVAVAVEGEEAVKAIVR